MHRLAKELLLETPMNFLETVILHIICLAILYQRGNTLLGGVPCSSKFSPHTNSSDSFQASACKSPAELPVGQMVA